MRGADAGFNGTLNPSVVGGGMFAGKMDPSFRESDVRRQLRHLVRLHHREGAAGVRIAHPTMACSRFKFTVDLFSMDDG